MVRISDLTRLPPLNGSVVTDGMFDGLHLGHQKILKTLVGEARAKGLPSVVLSYWPHPRLVLHPEDTSLKILTTADEKRVVLEELGLDYFITLPFSLEFAALSHHRFLEEILWERLHVRKLLVGYDHRFGKDRMGNVEYLQRRGGELGFEVEEVPRQEVEEIGVSSTRIRKALQEFDIGLANRFLGRPYTITGKVVPGDQKGRLLGYPTANLETSEKAKLIPADGVYLCRVKRAGIWMPAMTNIGYRPTVGGREHRLETHILGFSGDLYGQTLTLEFLDTLRKEQRFPDMDALRQQLQADEAEALRRFALRVNGQADWPHASA
jgi:riboflavin kinase/FMN adenylyltransferase